MTIRIAVVEDQAMVRAGLTMVVDSQPDLTVVLEASDGFDLPSRLAQIPVDVVLMDIQMPRVNGIQATEAVMAMPDPPRVIVLTTFDTDEHLLGAIRAGASGFLLKDAEPEDLLAAIRTVHEGEAVISSRMTVRLLDFIGRLPDRGLHAQQAAHLTAALTPREREVLEAMARGASNPEIAAALQLSEATVKSHVGRIFAKTGSRDRVHAVILAFQDGLVDPAELESQASRCSTDQMPARKKTTAKHAK
jgi:DNA-binding NarL/FixJ family response regulator